MDSLFECIVRSGDVTVNYYSEIDLYPLFADKNYTLFFPEFSCQRGKDNLAPSVIYYNQERQLLDFGQKRVIAKFPWRMMQKGRAILYLGYPLLEYQRQKKGGLTAHAAAFSIGKRGILVLGKVGAGKSSTTIEVCRKKEAALIANDLCLLSNSSNEFSITGGTKFLFLRLESVRRNMLGLETFFDTRESLDSWLNKEIIQPQEIDIQIEKEVVPLSAAFLVHIDERQNSLFVKKAHDLATILYLNENFSRYIRSTCTTMLGGPNHQILGYIPSLDNEHFFKKRKDLIEYLINNLGLVYVSGKLSDVVLYIESQLQM